MDSDELAETVMDKNNRTLKQITIDNMDEARLVINNLMGASVAPRRRFIEENAQIANLDIQVSSFMEEIMSKTITAQNVVDYISKGEMISFLDNIIVVELNKDVDTYNMKIIYDVLKKTNPKANIMVMSENWLNWIKGGNESDELLVKLVEAYENYLKAQASRI